MNTNAARNLNPTINIFKGQEKTDKNRAVTFCIQSAQSIPCQTVAQNNKNNREACLPINFFHTPGQYNKMLIQLKSNQKFNVIDRHIGILKSLQYLNYPIFDKAKQKRQQRLKDYENKKRQQRSIKIDSRISKCICCCCDDFCQDCAANTLCEASQSADQNGTSRKLSPKWLIDIQGMKKGEYKKKSKILVNSNTEVQRCHQRREISHIRIEELINKTLIQKIQQKRDKQLQLLVKRQQISTFKQFNESVRVNNRCSSAEKFRSKIDIKPTKAEIRQAYWESIKDLISYKLKKPKSTKLQKKITEQNCHKRSPDKYDIKVLEKLQVKRGKSAERQLKKAKLEKAQKARQKMEKLQVLDAQQRIIIKKCHSKRFKPDNQMIETAFAHFL